MIAYEDIFEYCHDYDSSRPIDMNLFIDNIEVCNFMEAMLRFLPIPARAKRKTTDQAVKYLNIFIANFAKSYLDRECVAIPRSSRFLNGETPFCQEKLSKGTFITVLEFLKYLGLIQEHMGHYDQETQSGQISRYWATPQLYAHFATVRNADLYYRRNIPPVILHRSARKEVSFVENKISKFFAEKICILNTLYNSNIFKYNSNIQYKVMNPHYLYLNNINHYNIRQPSILGRNKESSNELLYPNIDAIFSRNSFDCGGRLYSITKRGIGWQSLSQEQRKTITINDESTVELDFKSLHASMLYAIRGIQIHDDPYLISTIELRPIYKTLLLRLLNAKSIRETIFSMHKTERELKQKPLISSKYLKFLNCANQHNQNWMAYIDELMHHHQAIRRFFGSDCGIYLQRLDAEMMLNILSVLAQEGIPALPIHDSVIVARNHQKRTIEVMQNVYRRYMGFDCIVEAK